MLMYQGTGCDDKGTASPASSLQIHSSGYKRLSLGICLVLTHQVTGYENTGTASPASSLQIHGSGYVRLSMGMLGVDASGHWCALTRAPHCRRHLHLPCSTMAAGTIGSLRAAGHRHVWAMGMLSPTLRCSTVAVGRGGFALSRRNFEEVCVISTIQ